MKNSIHKLASAMLLLSLVHCAYAGGGRFVRETQAQKLSRALTDTEMVVGVYEYPDMEGRGPDWYYLKDGTHIRKYQSHLRDWRAMRLVQPIKGETDNIVLFRAYPLFSNNMQFLPLHGSRWILFLNPLLTKAGKLRPYSNYHTDDDLVGIQAAKPDIVFELSEGAYGAVCIQWPEEHSPGATTVHSEELVDDLIAICSAQSVQGQKAEELSPLELKTSLGREIAAVQHIPVSEPEETEP